MWVPILTVAQAEVVPQGQMEMVAKAVCLLQQLWEARAEAVLAEEAVLTEAMPDMMELITGTEVLEEPPETALPEDQEVIGLVRVQEATAHMVRAEAAGLNKELL